MSRVAATRRCWQAAGVSRENAAGAALSVRVQTCEFDSVRNRIRGVGGSNATVYAADASGRIEDG